MERKSPNFGWGKLTVKSNIMAWLPIEFGVSAGYKVREKNGFTNFIISSDINDFDIVKSSFLNTFIKN